MLARAGGQNPCAGARWEVGQVFFGQHRPRLDDKGRLILPAKFRDELADGVALSRGQEDCIVVWPMAAFEQYAISLRAGSQTNEQVRSYRRVLYASVFDQVPDKQGRITVPPALREWAHLERDCVVNGNDTTLEIWNDANWQQWESTQRERFANLDGEVVPMT